ncbi:molybdopterin-binding protein [Desulfofundulus thermobenzoicus]|uniref:Molybdopterin molybdenumtransferase n=1 Tax=Desulfofundulus thermobenzoicus TaxID=29376 RepID=A0A6N7ILG7_9FIRM|nr:molybdopterin-binding protein [Desulfofundulus thermobenzoicus]MQL50791.1 molybdopterin-binding protein [Desulfofundulus thermobenzoicus]
MLKVPVEKAVGMILCHDITEIVPGKFKGCAFKKGHIVREEDIPKLLRLGKENLYVWEKKEGVLHEDEAACRMARAVAGSGVALTEPTEGRINLLSTLRGLLKINVGALQAINNIEQVMLASLHTNQVVEINTVVAGTRVIPLYIDEKIIEQVEEQCAGYGPVVEVKPLASLRVGMVVTGSEVYKGRIEDRFSPVVKEKIENLGSHVFRKINVTDDTRMIAGAIQSLMVEKADLIVITGGMSVDPDDLTPAGVVAAGGKIVSYGAPVLPGAMFMVAYIGETPVLGLPGCVMFAKSTVFDLVLPRIMAGEVIDRRDIVALGHGGLCRGCPTCRFPACSFGKV